MTNPLRWYISFFLGFLLSDLHAKQNITYLWDCYQVFLFIEWDIILLTMVGSSWFFWRSGQHCHDVSLSYQRPRIACDMLWVNHFRCHGSFIFGKSWSLFIGCPYHRAQSVCFWQHWGVWLHSNFYTCWIDLSENRSPQAFCYWFWVYRILDGLDYDYLCWGWWVDRSRALSSLTFSLRWVSRIPWVFFTSSSGSSCWLADLFWFAMLWSARVSIIVFWCGCRSSGFWWWLRPLICGWMLISYTAGRRSHYTCSSTRSNISSSSRLVEFYGQREVIIIRLRTTDNYL